MRIVDLDTAMSAIQSGMRIFVQGMAATPHGLLAGLAERCRSLEEVRLFHMHLEGPTPWIAPALKGRVHDISFFVGPNLREAVARGDASYLPLFLSDIPWFLRQPNFRPHVALLNVSPPDRHGYVSLGPSVDATLTAVEMADVVIAQINPHVPRTLGEACIHQDAITFGVPWSEPLATRAAAPPDPVTEAIGRHVASLIPDRATLQIGIGRIPDAVLRQLVHHRDLGIHSEMLSDGVRDLAERGVVTGRYKVTDPGKIVGTFALGSEALYAFLDDNAAVAMRVVDYTNNTAVIRQNPRMVSVNSAVEVDLTGQVAAESIGPRVISGVGGQMDFVRGASLAPEGRSIIALPSRTASGQARIVATLKAGAAVTTTRNHVQYVVTEYGIAELHGRTLEERARRLIAVAHPEDRPALEEAAARLIPGW
ncbi:MAG: 4-hydroxybutyrate CoA-transferase [Actinomycetia bacterium]|nr:4-hydroxybutyrate CoA-transferase [Actinomycetes bacterium]